MLIFPRRLQRFSLAAIFVWLLLNSSSAIMTAQAQPRAYVTNRCNNTVAVIDIDTNSVVRTIPVGPFPVGIGVAITSDGPRVYVTNLQSGTVSVIDAATDTIIATIPVAAASFNMAVAPDGAHVYLLNSAGTVSVIDTKTNTVVNTISAGMDPSAVTPDGSRLYGIAGSGIRALDLATNTVLSTTPVRINPFGVVFRPDGLFAYVEAPDQHLQIINTALNTVILDALQIGTFHDHMVMAPDGTRLYVTSPFNLASVVVIDPSTNAVVNTIPIGNGPIFPALTSDGTRLYTVNIENTVSVIDTVTNTAIATIPIIDMPNDNCVLRIAVTPVPKSKDDCKASGYRKFAFTNQGQCVKYVNQHAN